MRWGRALVLTQRMQLETGHWGWAEVRSIARSLSAFHTTRSEARKLEATASRMYGERQLVAVNSGRGALALALRVLSQAAPDRQRVLVPEYVCPAVPETIIALGLEPVAVPVGADLNLDIPAVERAFDDSTLAVIAVHMYARQMATEALVDRARAAGVAIIDDAAHSLADPADEGPSPGTAGAFGVISFAQSKSVSCGYSGSGGLLLVNEPELAERLADLEPLPPAHAAGRFGYWLRGRHVSSVASKFWRFDRWLKEREGMDSRSLPKNVTSIAEVHAALALDQFRSFPARRAEKIRVAERYAAELEGCVAVRFPQYRTGQYLTRVMLQVTDADRYRDLRKSLADAGIATRQGYPPLQMPRYDGTPSRAFHLLEVPSNTGMADADIARVAELVRRS